jgi:hypothetical protein
MARVYVLGGRTFAPTETLTGRQDGWLIVQTQDIGLTDILKKRLSNASTDKDETDAADQEVARSLIVEAHRSGKYHHVIAGRLVEDGKKWNPKDAEANAEYFAELSDPADKSQLTTAFVEVLNGFFMTVAGFLTASQTSSAKTTTATAPAVQPPTAAANSTSNQGATDGPSVPDVSPLATVTA